MVAFDPVTTPSYDRAMPGPVMEPAPVRRPGSVRRTSHLDATRSQQPGFPGVMRIAGAARDVVTGSAESAGGPAAGGPEAAGPEAAVTGTAALHVGVDERGLIDVVEHEPANLSCQSLIGQRVGFGFRSGAKELLGSLSGSLLGLLVDDLSGAPSPSGYGAIRDRIVLGLPPLPPPPGRSSGPRADVCSGWRTSGLAFGLASAGEPLPFEAEPPIAPELSSEDPFGWHAMPTLHAGQSRRIRRLDVWFEGDHLLVDAMFRDSTCDPNETARVVHEYALTATLDADSQRILAIEAEPRALPFPTDCPFAADSVQLILGQPAAGLREAVRVLSAGAVSCTHLNDAMRCLADIPTLVGQLRA
ncbi:MAG: hypothetical protein JWO63_1409 [Frankiales bacterium]|nr:hypothetical protein [Frankiales bacterium]